MEEATPDKLDLMLSQPQVLAWLELSEPEAVAWFGSHENDIDDGEHEQPSVEL